MISFKGVIRTPIIYFIKKLEIMSNRDFYDILGIGRNASDDEIKAAFRKLARQYHPDVI